MKAWRWALILFPAAAAGIVLSVYLLTRQPGGSVAAVYSDGELICRIDLQNPGDWREYTVSYGGEVNTIIADADGIRVVSASCPDGLCVKQGNLRAAPIVCLPNRLVIKWLSAAEAPYDAIAR